jgi:hypothetical protein
MMTEERLETFQTHPGIKKLRGKRMAQTMYRVTLLLKPCLLEIVHEVATASTVTEALVAVAVKDKLLVLVSSPKPKF